MQLPGDQSSQADDSKYRKGDDEARPEPVVFLTFVEHYFERTESKSYKAETNQVEPESASLGFLDLLLDLGSIFYQPMR
jgi:hypothetical protein